MAKFYLSSDEMARSAARRWATADIYRHPRGTVADVYYLTHFGDLRGTGLLGSGLIGAAARIGLREGEPLGPTTYLKRYHRTAAILGAIAFEMLTMYSDPARPEPRTAGISAGEFEKFQDAVACRLVNAGLGTAVDYANDFALLAQMNNETLDFLLFHDLSQTAVTWHDRTVQAFFAAYWATKCSTPPERERMRQWVVDSSGEALKGFDEFWTFAAEMPDPAADSAKWLDVFKACYTAPQKLTGAHDFVQWNRRMIYHSFPTMERRAKDVIEAWRQSYMKLATGSAEQQRIVREIEGGFRDIPAGVCPFGADPDEGEAGVDRAVAAFRMHQWQVTNEMYEQFDPAHGQDRWYVGSHLLVQKLGKGGDDRCPVVSVTWYNAWCFAAWCGKRLLTELEWEYACRAGSRGSFSVALANDEHSFEIFAATRCRCYKLPSPTCRFSNRPSRMIAAGSRHRCTACRTSPTSSPRGSWWR